MLKDCEVEIEGQQRLEGGSTKFARSIEYQTRGKGELRKDSEAMTRDLAPSSSAQFTKARECCSSGVPRLVGAMDFLKGHILYTFLDITTMGSYTPKMYRTLT